MTESDATKLMFVRTNLQVDNLLAILFLIDRGQLVQSIEMVPESEKNNPQYNVLRRTLEFYDDVIKLQVNGNLHG